MVRKRGRVGECSDLNFSCSLRLSAFCRFLKVLQIVTGSKTAETQERELRWAVNQTVLGRGNPDVLLKNFRKMRLIREAAS